MLVAPAVRDERPYTERFRSSLMALISIFLRPMVDGYTQTSKRIERGWGTGAVRLWLAMERRRGTKEVGTSLRGSVTLKTLSVSGSQQQAAKVGADGRRWFRDAKAICLCGGTRRPETALTES